MFHQMRGVITLGTLDISHPRICFSANLHLIKKDKMSDYDEHDYGDYGPEDYAAADADDAINSYEYYDNESSGIEYFRVRISS